MRLKYEELGNAMAAAEFMARRGVGGRVRVVEVYEDQDIGDLFLVDAEGWAELGDEIEDEDGAAVDVLVHYEAGADAVEEVA